MIDFIKTEEKLINSQLNILKCIKEKEVLSKIDNFYSKIEDHLPSKIFVTMKVAEELSDGKFKMPLKIRGKMLGVGRHKNRFYSEEELKKSIEINKGKKIPLKVDHRLEEISANIGLIDRIYWSESNKAVMYEAHINDETHARNVLDGVETEVSASIFSRKDFDQVLGIVWRDLEYSELSIV